MNLTAHVTSLYDNTSYLFGPLQVGQVVTASYTYDTDTPPSGAGQYSLSVPPGSVSVTAGPLTFASLPTSQITVNVRQGSEFQVFSSHNNTLPDGRLVDAITFDFVDNTGQSPSSSALPAAAPNLQSYAGIHQIRIPATTTL